MHEGNLKATNQAGSLPARAKPRRVTSLPVRIRWATALACFLGSLSINSAEAQTNLALGKSAVASSTQFGSPAKAIDGNLTTRWGSQFTNDEWIYVDLLTPLTFNKVTLHWQNSYAASYKIQTSNDANQWIDQATITGNTGGQNDITFPAVTSQYVRMLGLTRSGSFGYSLYEFEIYDTVATIPVITSGTTAAGIVGAPFSYQITALNNPTSYNATGVPPGLIVNHATGLISGTPTLAGGPTAATVIATNSSGSGNGPLNVTISPSIVMANISQYRAVTASSAQSGNAAANASDSNLSTRWSANNGTFPQWWRVDLGANTSLSRVDIAWYVSSTRSYKYKIEASTDDLNYSVVLDRTAHIATGDTSDSLPNITGRYLRLTVTGSSEGYASAYEISFFGNSTTDSIRVVDVDDKVVSRKRGVCENSLSSADFTALAPGVSWFYNWSYSTSDIPPADAAMTFLPMVWGTAPANLPGLSAYLANANPKPPVILGINEPNLKGQAFIDPQTTANFFAQIKATGDQYAIPVIGPNMALGSAAEDSITAYDPIQHMIVTYTSGESFMNAFFYYTNAILNPSALAVNSFSSDGNTFTMKISSYAGRDYQLFKTNALDSDSWTAVETKPGTGSELTFSYTHAPNDAQEFYSIKTTGTSAGVPAVAFHTYGGLGELQYFVQHFYDLYHRPVWVTEFALWSAGSPAAARITSSRRPTFSSNHRWLPAMPGSRSEAPVTPNLSLLAAQPGALTLAGQAYVDLPSHDPDLYHRLPGRLQAESYLHASNCGMRVTTDTDGEFDLTLSANPQLDYNLQVDIAATYTIKFRAAGIGTVTLLQDGVTLASIDTKNSGWQTVSISAALPAGAQTVQVKAVGSVNALNWIEFQ